VKKKKPSSQHRQSPWQTISEKPEILSSRSIHDLEKFNAKKISTDQPIFAPYHVVSKNTIRTPRKLLKSGTVRESYLFKELIDKPVAFKD